MIGARFGPPIAAAIIAVGLAWTLMAGWVMYIVEPTCQYPGMVVTVEDAR